MFLRSIGYRPVVEASFLALDHAALQPARVVRADLADARVVLADATERRVLVRARVGVDGPLVAGDWVAIDPALGVVTHVLPRNNAFERRRVGKREVSQVIAANVDVAAIVMALDGDFSPRRVSRYLALAHAQHIAPVVVLTKAGLRGDVAADVEAVARVAIGVPVSAVDVPAQIGLDAVRALAEAGQTVVLLGSSGVGKSTLANHLLGRDAVATGGVRERDGKGRHTTTHRQLHVLPGGGALIDTPGLREVALFGDDDGLDRTFDDITAFAADCRFRDCRHDGEPGCAVARAVEGGALDADRVNEAAQLRDELERTQGRARERERRGVERQASKALRRVLRDKGRR